MLSSNDWNKKRDIWEYKQSKWLIIWWFQNVSSWVYFSRLQKDRKIKKLCTFVEKSIFKTNLKDNLF